MNLENENKEIPEEFKKLSEDSKLDHVVATLVSLVLIASSNNNLFLLAKLEFLLIVDLFFLLM